MPLRTSETGGWRRIGRDGWGRRERREVKMTGPFPLHSRTPSPSINENTAIITVKNRCLMNQLNAPPHMLYWHTCLHNTFTLTTCDDWLLGNYQPHPQVRKGCGTFMHCSLRAVNIMLTMSYKMRGSIIHAYRVPDSRYDEYGIPLTNPPPVFNGLISETSPPTYLLHLK